MSEQNPTEMAQHMADQLAKQLKRDGIIKEIEKLAESKAAKEAADRPATTTDLFGYSEKKVKVVNWSEDPGLIIELDPKYPFDPSKATILTPGGEKLSMVTNLQVNWDADAPTNTVTLTILNPKVTFKVDEKQKQFDEAIEQARTQTFIAMQNRDATIVGQEVTSHGIEAVHDFMCEKAVVAKQYNLSGKVIAEETFLDAEKEAKLSGIRYK